MTLSLLSPLVVTAALKSRSSPLELPFFNVTRLSALEVVNAVPVLSLYTGSLNSSTMLSLAPSKKPVLASVEVPSLKVTDGAVVSVPFGTVAVVMFASGLPAASASTVPEPGAV